MMGFYIMLCTVHTTQGQGQGQGQVTIVTVRNEVWGKVMFLHVCHSVHGRGVASQHASGVSLQGGLHPGGLHRGRGALGTHTRALRDMVNK